MRDVSDFSNLRRGVIVALSLALFGTCFAIVLNPEFRDIIRDKYAMFAALAFIGLLGVGRGKLWHKPGRYFWALVVIVHLCAPFVTIAQGFGSFDMMAFLFHMEFGVEGAGFEELHNAIITTMLSLGWIVFAAYALSKALAWQCLPYLLTGALLISSHPMVIYAVSAVHLVPPESDLAERLVLAPRWNGKAADHDLVVLYLEGLEAAYFDPSYLGDGLASFAATFDNGLHFKGVRQVEGTGWSIAGLVATQCGVPLLPNGFRARNNFDGVGDFLGKHRCLGDILKQAGYQLEFLQGGDLNFAGYGTFLGQHGFDKVMGIKHLRENYPAELIQKATAAGWLDDQLIFSEALKRHRALLKKDAPYGLFIQSITTHGDTAVVSRECLPADQAELVKMNPTLLACVGRQLSELVNVLREQAGSRPMRLVILSDHLNHSVSLKANLPLAERANTVVMINPQDAERVVIDKDGSMIDIYPTLLDWMELVSNGERKFAGLGVSLLSQVATLVEEKGLGPLNEELYINPKLNSAIWHEALKSGQ
jgi:phosphoglycerol transferase